MYAYSLAFYNFFFFQVFIHVELYGGFGMVSPKGEDTDSMTEFPRVPQRYSVIRF